MKRHTLTALALVSALGVAGYPYVAKASDGEERLWNEVAILLERPCEARMRFTHVIGKGWYLAPQDGAGLPVSFLFPDVGVQLEMIETAKAIDKMSTAGERVWLHEVLTVMGGCE